MSDQASMASIADDTTRGTVPQIADLLSDPSIAAEFEQASAALEAADIVRRMRRQALSTIGVQGISQAELAQRTGLSQPRISQIEQGRGRDGLSYALLRRIAFACGVDWTKMILGGLETHAPVAASGGAVTKSVSRAAQQNEADPEHEPVSAEYPVGMFEFYPRGVYAPFGAVFVEPDNSALGSGAAKLARRGTVGNFEPVQFYSPSKLEST